MKSTHWLDEAKKAAGIESDYQLAARLGMTRAAISNHRQGIATTLKDEHAYKIEELMNLPHGEIVLDQHAERATDPKISAMWRELGKMASGSDLRVVPRDRIELSTQGFSETTSTSWKNP